MEKSQITDHTESIDTKASKLWHKYAVAAATYGSVTSPPIYGVYVTFPLV